MTPSFVATEALNNHAIVNRVMDTVVGVWDLAGTREEAPESAVSYTYKTDKVTEFESVIGGDDRQKVHPSDFQEGGKYRSIVKLFLHYEGQGDRDEWAMGTGWLIAPDLLVTAGHCVFDYSHKLGPLTKVKCYIGYDGKGSIPTRSTQFRQGKRVAAPAEWLKGPTMPYDVGFIILDSPFTGITPIKFADTPSSGNMNMGVVGYPGDLERGEHMYEHFLFTRFDLASSGKMLTYEVDSFGGNSGSPVLLSTGLVSIGVHCYGGATNKASVIGPLGNIFPDYIKAIRGRLGKKTPQGISFVTIPADSNGGNSSMAMRRNETNPYSRGYTTRSNGNGYRSGAESTFETESYGVIGSYGSSSGEMEEGFWGDLGSVLKKGIKIVAPLANKGLSTVLPLALGPVGGPIAAVTSVALNAVGSIATESAFGGAESALDAVNSIDGSLATEGLAERAVLGEAALQAIMTLRENTLREYGIFDTMSNVVRARGPAAQRAAPQIMNVVLPAALNVTLDALNKTQSSRTESFEMESEWPAEYQSNRAGHRSSNRSSNSKAEAFSSAMGEDAEEGFFGDAMRWVARKAIEVSPTVISGIQKGLEIVAQLTPPKTESGFSADNSTPPTIDGLVERTMLQEAALEAILKLPERTLHEEGLFDVMREVVRQLGPTVIKASSAVIKAVAPIADKAAGKTESTYNNQTRGSNGLRKKRSAIFNGEGAEANFIGAYRKWDSGTSKYTSGSSTLRVSSY